MKYELVENQKILCYDFGEGVADRYTVFYLSEKERNGHTPLVAMGPCPYHPQGFFQHGSGVPGKHCGKKIPFSSLPEDCRRAIERDLSPE